MSLVLVREGLSRAIQSRKDLPSMGMALMAQGSTLNKRGRRRKPSWIPVTCVKKHWDLEMGGSLARAGQLAQPSFNRSSRPGWDPPPHTR